MTARRFLSTSVDATEAFAARLAPLLPLGTVIALDGELGAGKTAFVRGLARGLGVADPVASPTFALMHVYAAGEGGRELWHLDAWQVQRGEAFLADGGAEELLGAAEAGAIVAVEWAERVAAWLPRPRLAVRLAHRREGRAVELEVVSAGAAAPTGAEGALAAALARLDPPPGLEASA